VNGIGGARGLHVVVAVVLAVAAGGFFAGTRDIAVRPVQARPVPVVAAQNVPAAPSWQELRARRQATPMATRIEGREPQLAAPDSDVLPLFEKRPQALAARATLRAFDGAPPVVPHPVPQKDALPCLACHAEGLQIGTLRAAKMSHEPYPNCTQCHVPQEGSVPPEMARLPQSVGDSAFTGLAAPERGPRAWTFAPPVQPHPTWMRERCDSCHGPSARPGLHTSHPWRQNCLQCHASSADRDQRPRTLEDAP
jgi:cytochrome c-type protein NapB